MKAVLRFTLLALLHMLRLRTKVQCIDMCRRVPPLLLVERMMHRAFHGRAAALMDMLVVVVIPAVVAKVVASMLVEAIVVVLAVVVAVIVVMLLVVSMLVVVVPALTVEFDVKVMTVVFAIVLVAAVVGDSVDMFVETFPGTSVVLWASPCIVALVVDVCGLEVQFVRLNIRCA